MLFRSVQAIAVAHNGSVRVRSAVGQGSVFEIVLPAAARETAPIGRAVAS